VAKISARGATEIARVRSTKTGTSYLLRSDQVVLQKLNYDGAGWTKYANAKDREAGLRFLNQLGPVQWKS